MEALGLERTGMYLCKRCKKRFVCFTNKETPYGGLCSGDEFFKLDYETVKQIHIEKAKEQGHYYVSHK